MTEEEKTYKKELSVKWIKAESGSTYLCPVASLEKINAKNEDQLKMICVDESLSPHNQ